MLKGKKTIHIIIIVLLGLFLAVLIVGILWITSCLSKIQYDDGEQVVGTEDIQELLLSAEEILRELLVDEPISDELNSAQEEISALEEQMVAQLAQKV